MGSILWVILQRGRFDSVSHKKFNSLSHMQKKFNQYQKKSSILWVILENKIGSILWVILKKTSTLVVILRRGSKKKSSILWVIYKEFNSVSHLSKKKISIFWVSFLIQNPILWIILVKKEEVQFCKSYKNSSILWVLFRKNASIRVKIEKEKKKLNSLRQIRKKGSILWVIQKRVQFFESYKKKV